MCFRLSVQFTFHPNCFIFSINFSLLIQFSSAFNTAIAQSATKLSFTCCRNRLYLSLLHATTSPFSIWLTCQISYWQSLYISYRAAYILNQWTSPAQNIALFFHDHIGVSPTILIEYKINSYSLFPLDRDPV